MAGEGEALKISAQLTIGISVIFALICFGVAITGWTSLGEITDPAQMSDAHGYIGFWAFLGTISVVMGLGAWCLIRTGLED
jgi:hypothetical protein